MKPCNNLENKTPSYIYWRVQLVFKKVQVHSSLEPPLEYSQDQMLWKIIVCLTFLTIFGSYRNIMQFQISSRRWNR